MTNAALTFDKLAYIDRLKGGGIEEQQARIHAVATKADIKETRQEIEVLGKDLRQELELARRDVEDASGKLRAEIATSAAALKVDILRWLVVTQIALAGLNLAAVKFVK
jgi:hypothetical protein